MNNIGTPSQKKDLDVVLRALRHISVRVADVAFKIHLRPNHITLFRFYILGGIAAVCLVKGGYIFNLIALTMLGLGFFLDLVDGDLARRHDLRSNYGAELEDNLDAVLLSIVLLAISTNAYVGHTGWGFVGLICLFSQIFSMRYTELYKSRFGIDCVESNPHVEDVQESKSLSIYDRFTIELLVPKKIIFSLFSNFRYYLVFGVLANQLVISLMVFSVMLTLRWIWLAHTTVAYAHNLDTSESHGFYSVLASLDKLGKR